MGQGGHEVLATRRTVHLAVHTGDPGSSWSRQKHHLSTRGHSGQPCRILYLLRDCLPASIHQPGPTAPLKLLWSRSPLTSMLSKPRRTSALIFILSTTASSFEGTRVSFSSPHRLLLFLLETSRLRLGSPLISVSAAFPRYLTIIWNLIPAAHCYLHLNVSNLDLSLDLQSSKTAAMGISNSACPI